MSHIFPSTMRNRLSLSVDSSFLSCSRYWIAMRHFQQRAGRSNVSSRWYKENIEDACSLQVVSIQWFVLSALISHVIQTCCADSSEDGTDHERCCSVLRTVEYQVIELMVTIQIIHHIKPCQVQVQQKLNDPPFTWIWLVQKLLIFNPTDEDSEAGKKETTTIHPHGF